MSVRASLYSHDGQYQTDVQSHFKYSWKLNAYGEATFELSIRDPKCEEKNIEFGNLLLLEHDVLPDWGGKIWTPREWTPGKVKVCAYGGEFAMELRITQREQTITDSPGRTFETLIDEIMSEPGYQTVKSGDIYGDGTKVKRVYHYETLYSQIEELSKASQNDWNCVADFDANGALFFWGNWYKKLGRRAPYTLVEGHNIKQVSSPLLEQGKIINKLRMYGDGSTWMTKPVAPRNDLESAHRYGIAYGSESAPGTTLEQLRARADTRIEETANPRKTLQLIALDKRDTFKWLDIGNTIGLVLKTAGFNHETGGFGLETTVRILQMAYDTSTNQVTLIVDEDEEE
jgi:hypothetical protein